MLRYYILYYKKSIACILYKNTLWQRCRRQLKAGDFYYLNNPLSQLKVTTHSTTTTNYFSIKCFDNILRTTERLYPTFYIEILRGGYFQVGQFIRISNTELAHLHLPTPTSSSTTTNYFYTKCRPWLFCNTNYSILAFYREIFHSSGTAGV